MVLYCPERCLELQGLQISRQGQPCLLINFRGWRPMRGMAVGLGPLGPIYDGFAAPAAAVAI